MLYLSKVEHNEGYDDGDGQTASEQKQQTTTTAATNKEISRCMTRNKKNIINHLITILFETNKK